jgi:uncharacterized protein involved in exopolysaccharide biosynthesis
VEAFTEADRERTISIQRRTDSMAARLESIERRQRSALRHQRTIAPAVAKAIAGAISRRAVFLLAAGMVLGSALGGAAMELARKLVLSALAGH